MNKKIVAIVLSILLLLVVASVVAAVTRWNKPLGPSLGLPTRTASPLVPTNLPTVTATLPAPQGDPSTLVITATQPVIPVVNLPALTPTLEKQPLCNGPDSMSILVIGSDQRGTSYLYGLSDSIFIMHIDFKTPKVMVVDFPRDLWVEIPEISDHYGVTHGKINQAYFFGNPGMGYYDGPGAGPGLLALTLYHNFGVIVDHYIAVDMTTLKNLVDAVGGVDITLDEPIDLSYGYDSTDPGYYLHVGTNHLDGEQVVILAQNRVPSTFQRMKYQRIIFSALRDKMVTPEFLPKIPQLVTQFIGSVRTDLSPSVINQLICIAQAVPKENIQADSFPQDMFTNTVTYDQYRNVTTFIQEADFSVITAMMADFMNGIWPFP